MQNHGFVLDWMH